MLYNQPRTIEEMFSEAAQDTVDGRSVNWYSILISCGLIDIDKSKKNNVVCVTPSSQYHYNELKEKIKWLRPYCSVAPLISDVIKKMDDIL